MSNTVRSFGPINEGHDGWQILTFDSFYDSTESKDLCGCGPTRSQQFDIILRSPNFGIRRMLRVENG